MRKNISSGAPWENQIGYCRAVRVGNTIEVSGTAPVRDGKTVGDNAYEQTKACLEIIKEAIENAGGKIEDVVRTRMFVTDISQWVAIGKAHGEVFTQIKPATTMVEVKALIEADMLIEIEATALVSS
ncbi:RidA family protein [Ekhidna sp.]|uniref:RidA family protein n=1 Tax=Ekhidna sp. TaxID=2608089 RepID=UPI0032998BD3